MQNDRFKSFPISNSSHDLEDGAVVVDLQAFRLKKMMTGDKRRGVQDTFSLSDHDPLPDNSVPNQTGRREEELASRLERIKSSIQRINQLMADLRDSNQPHKPL
jgi:hypothetical protein